MTTSQPLIAVIDDEKVVCRALERLLVASRFDVITFPSGKEFMESLNARHFDCAVLDLNMPGLGGLDVLKWLRNEGCRMPIIIITGRDERSIRSSCLAAGASAYLPKPLDPSDLLQAIANALHCGKL